MTDDVGSAADPTRRGEAGIDGARAWYQPEQASRANVALETGWDPESPGRLTTRVTRRPRRPPAPGEATIEMLAVPLHGSFWLATDPRALHPRMGEFMAEDRFVFGNGGVGRVVEAAPDSGCAIGDLVAVLGHLPCANEDCVGCHEIGRFTECDYGQGQIVGHGKGAPDGTLARYCTLPGIALEVLPSTLADADRDAAMFTFLLADVRNALLRVPSLADRRRVLILGAGFAGHLAAWLLLQHCPGIQILVVEPNGERARSVSALAPDRISETSGLDRPLADALTAAFGRRGADLVFDASSGDSLPSWLRPDVLRPGSAGVLFGFGSGAASFSPALSQVSGISLHTSRGVGDGANRRAAARLLGEGAAAMIRQRILPTMTRLDGIERAAEFVHAHHALAAKPFETPRAWVAPTTDPGHSHGG